ncbi:MAG: hypothetical protein ACMXYL_00235 [Candidatus Woesearchaeota archaeon]
MDDNIFDTDYERRIKEMSPNDNKGMGFGRRLSKAYARHKKTLLGGSITLAVGIGALTMALEGIHHYRIGMERAGESHVVKTALSDYENALDRINVLSIENESLNARIINAQQIDTRRSNELISLRSSHSESLSRIDALTAENDSLKATIADYESVIAEHNDMIVRMSSSTTDYERIINEHNITISSLENTVHNLNAIISDNESLLDQYNSMVWDRDNTISRLENDIASLLEDSDTTNIVSHYEGIIASKNTRIVSLEASVHNLRSQLGDYDSTILSLEQALESKRRNNHDYSVQMSEYNAIITDQQSTISSLEIQLSSLSGMTDVLEEKNSLIISYESMIREKDDIISRLEDDIDNILTSSIGDDTISEYERIISQRNNTIEGLEQALNNEKAHNNDSARRLSEYSVIINDQAASIAYYEGLFSTMGEIIVIVEEQEKMIASYESTISEKDNTIEELEQALNHERTQNNDNAGQLSEYRTIIRDQQSTITSLEVQLSGLNNLTSALEDQDNLISSYESIIRDNENEIARLEGIIRGYENNVSINNNDTYDNSALRLLGYLGNNNSDIELLLELDNYDALLYYDNNANRITLDIIDKGCRDQCTSHARILSTPNNVYSLSWGSFNHPQGGYSLAKDAFDRAMGMVH